MHRRTLALSLLAIATIAGVEGCRRKVVPAPTPAAADTAGAAQLRADSLAPLAARAPRPRHVSIPAANAAASRDAAAAADRQAQVELTNVLAQKVYFDYDRDQLREDGAATLDAKAAVLQANPSITLVV